MAQMIILGIVQGLTEFLPVSSSAHLVFAEHFLALPRPGVVLEAVLHLGTALSAVVLFWPEVRRLVRAAIGRDGASLDAGYRRLAWLLLAATALTGLIGLIFQGSFERMFSSVRGTAVQLMITGVILLLARERGRRRMVDARFPDAAALGVAQGISIVPGISRSALTIAVGLWRGLTREEAARFSFLMAIPALVAAGLFALRDLGEAFILGYTPVELAVGFAVSALFGMIAIRWLMDWIRRGRLLLFAVYCWAAGLAVFLWTFR
ncbi:MAG TPA: undecaprenyl-diphosphate phosphatase [bacterium]|jgi:undecaprenyl-diphosphatase|nr:undecaprenyl-diphosphate phosphatase [bacterium]